MLASVIVLYVMDIILLLVAPEALHVLFKYYIRDRDDLNIEKYPDILPERLSHYWCSITQE